ncbi:MAG: hypothetical protein ABDH23_06425 [Endomicrobiia bacterium]
MGRYYLYKSYIGKKPNKRYFRLLKKIIVIIIFFVFLFLFRNNFLDFIKIRKIHIQENFTTLPDSIILQYLSNKHINVFNYFFVLKELQNKYREIYKIKLLNFPFFNRILKISILKRDYIFYISKYDNLMFYSRDKKWYRVYNSSYVINNNQIKEVCCEKYLDLEKLYKLNQILEDINIGKDVQKIMLKDNKEYMVYFKEGPIFILRENFEMIDKKKIAEVYNLFHKKPFRVYISLLDENIVFYSDL